ncbi:MAG: GH3 auxin-responsive promoter family protein [Bacteroidota bacterium]|nr:GH3 auxin-responsive promoter family protein [Bacteroidota bacterium]
MIFSLKNSLMSWVMRKRIHQIDLFLNYPHEVQKERLEGLLETAEKTEWGLNHGYKYIKSYESYKSGVPLSDYEAISPYINRLRKGEENILWPTKSKWFAKSSGTSGSRSKYIPVTKESLHECHFKAGKDMLSMYCNNFPETQVFNGKSVIMGGSHEPSLSMQKKDGDLSAIIVENLPFWVNIHQTPSKDIQLMSDFEKKIDQMATITSKEDVTNVSGVPSWMLVLFRKILEKTKAKHINEVWPNLELYIHGGVSFTPYKSQFDKLLPKGINYLETYNASEGFFGIQDQKNSDELLLMLDYGIFYEFIPADNIAGENAIPIWEVELGVNYALVISTNAGLWRYLIGDTIVFTSKQPYRFKITGRISHFINAFGEELIMDNAEKAIKYACNKSNAIVNEYTAGPKFMNETSTGTHEWIIEFENPPPDIDQFANDLDQMLKELNSDYAAKRNNNMALQKPIVHSVEKGTFYKWMKANNKLGRQFKVPRLANHRNYIESIFKLIQSLKS